MAAEATQSAFRDMRNACGVDPWSFTTSERDTCALKSAVLLVEYSRGIQRFNVATALPPYAPTG